ncbi:MAG: hypothetical protein ACUVXD_01540 [Thermodesulfobacteriota bacterium]
MEVQEGATSGTCDLAGDSRPSRYRTQGSPKSGVLNLRAEDGLKMEGFCRML